MNAKFVRLEGRVRDVVASGEAVVETERGLVFARGGLSGERLLLQLDAKRGRVQRARVLDVLVASPERVEPPCRYAARCGGCALMHASVAEQRRLRIGFLREALRKAGFSEVEVHASASDQQLGYRRRARLAFAVRGRAAELGFYREHSPAVTDVARCIVLEPALDRTLVLLRERLLPELRGQGEISLALGASGEPVVVVRAAEAQPPALYALADRLAPAGSLAGIALFVGGAVRPALFGDAREWSEGADGLPLEGTIGGFSQAQTSVNRALVARVVERAASAGARVLELYAGTGNFTVALAPHSASYTAVEQAPDAVAALRRNLSARSLTAKVVEADVREHAPRLAAADVVVLDPPRTGAPTVLAALAQRKPKRILYVSCDPATLARDLGELAARYTLTWVEAFEMFPQTADLESLAVLELKR